MKFEILTIFPKIFDSYLKESLFKRALAKKIIHVKVHDLRDYSRDRHKKVDDRPFGGGPGMVLKIGPIYRIVRELKSKAKTENSKVRIILFSARGKTFAQKDAKRLSRYKRVVFICGRYEGVDERVAKFIADEEMSVGDYILSGGELPALTVMEAICRYVPKFLGKKESLEDIKGSYPVYTRPAEFEAGRKKWKVPRVLLSGNHDEIKRWRKVKQARSKFKNHAQQCGFE